MIFSWVVPFKRKNKKIPDLSLPPCSYPFYFLGIFYLRYRYVSLKKDIISWIFFHRMPSCVRSCSLTTHRQRAEFCFKSSVSDTDQFWFGSLGSGYGSSGHYGSRASIYEQCYGSGMFVPDPGSEFFHPGSRIKMMPDPDPHIRILCIFNPKNCFKALGNMIRGVHPGSKKHRILDPDPQHWLWNSTANT